MKNMCPSIKKLYIALFVFIFCFSGAIKALEVGSQTPTCEATLLNDGQPLSLEPYKDKVLYVDFWATWCPPCKKSLPILNKLRDEFVDQGFEVIAINVDENTEDAKHFLKKFPVNYVVAVDPAGNCPAVYDVLAMPSSYFVDKQGVVRRIHLGFRSSDEAGIREEIISLLNEKKAQPY